MVRVVFENEYFCERCREFIGNIKRAYYNTKADLVLCEKCHNR